MTDVNRPEAEAPPVHEFPWDYTPGAIVESAICSTCGHRWDQHGESDVMAFAGGPLPELRHDEEASS